MVKQEIPAAGGLQFERGVRHIDPEVWFVPVSVYEIRRVFT